MRSLGEELGTVLLNVTSLIVKCRSGMIRSNLSQQRARIFGLLSIFVDCRLDASLPEYSAAIEALHDANAGRQTTESTRDEIATSTRKIDTAVERLVALAAVAAGGGTVSGKPYRWIYRRPERITSRSFWENLGFKLTGLKLRSGRQDLEENRIVRVDRRRSLAALRPEITSSS